MSFFEKMKRWKDIFSFKRYKNHATEMITAPFEVHARYSAVTIYC